MSPRFDAILFDAGGIVIMPDPIAIGHALHDLCGPQPISRFHRAHYASLSALEHWAVQNNNQTIERIDWTLYRRTYSAMVGVPADRIDDAVAALQRIWSPLLWRFRLEESLAVFWQLHLRKVPIGIVSNASGQVEGILRHEGICQVGTGQGVPVACVIDSEVVGVAKPDPAIFAPALAAIGNLDPSRVAYVGDSFINDIGGAAAAGLHPIQLDPYGDYADFAHERITSLHDLLAWV